MQPTAPSSDPSSSVSSQKLAERLHPAVRRMATRLLKRLPPSVQLDDLVSAGNLGLAQALAQDTARHDPAFEAYALTRIRGAMLDELRSTDPLSRGERRMVRRLEHTRHQLATALGRRPEADELSDAAQISEDACHELTARAAVGVNQRYDSLLPMYASSSSEHQPSRNAEEHAMRSQLLAQVSSCTQRLPARLRIVVTLYFTDELTLREISERLQVTEPRVHQLRNEALQWLREELLACDRRQPVRAFNPRKAQRSKPARAQLEASA